MIKVYENVGANGGATLTGYIHSPSREMPNYDNRPAILVIPGGGYSMVSDRENEPVALAFFAEGFNVFALQYSVGAAARDMQPLLEAAAAIAMMRSRAAEWHIIADKIAVCGFSAGGHLAGSIGILYNKPELLERGGYAPDQVRPDAMALCYPVITSGAEAHRGSFTNLTGSSLDDEANREYSLELYVTDKTPPAFIWHCVDDTCVPVDNSIILIEALRKHKVPFEAHLFEKGGHGISVCTREVGTPNPHCAHWVELFCEWLRAKFETNI
jgi:acetyl esterase/lipase